MRTIAYGITVASLLISWFIPVNAVAESVVRVGGSGTCTGAIKVLAKSFEAKNPGIMIKVMPSLGSSGGIKALLGGGLDIALSARPLKDEEKVSGAKVVFAGRTPFILLANKSVTQKNITSAELEDILLGKKLTWSDGKPIRLILRPEGDTDTKLIQAISPSISQAMKTAHGRSDKHIALTDQDSDRDIENTVGALGFSTISQVFNDRLSSRPLKFNHIAPSLKTLKSKSYPLAKEVLAIQLPSRTSPEIQKFIAFLNAPSTIPLLEKTGIVVNGN